MQAAVQRSCCCSAHRQLPLTLCAQLQLTRHLAWTSSAALTQRAGAAAASVDAGGTARPPYNRDPVEQGELVPVPLCKRPAQHVEQLSSLMQWRQGVLAQIQAIRDSFAAADGGPTAAELQKEVTWVLDDVVAAWRQLEQQQWLPCTWQQLQLEFASAARRQQQPDSWQVQLRAPVRDLQQLWQLRLQERVPFQYLIHTSHWRDLVLAVGPGILVPRPETEQLIDLAAAALAANTALAALPWADLGTGSGALAIGTARLLLQHREQQHHERQQPPSLGVAAEGDGMQEARAAPPCRVYAVDLSPTPVAYAAANASAHGVQGTVRVLQGSWWAPLQAEGGLQGGIGGVLSNPPYIPRPTLRAGLQAEVARHEPLSALDGGPGDGMDCFVDICSQAVHMLAPGGFIALETAGAEQAPLVRELLAGMQADGTHEVAGGGGGSSCSSSSSSPAFTNIRIHDDCYCVPRFVSATRTPGNGGSGGSV